MKTSETQEVVRHNVFFANDESVTIITIVGAKDDDDAIAQATEIFDDTYGNEMGYNEITVEQL